MLGTPLFGDTRVISNTGIVGDSTPGDGVTAGGSAGTYGSIVELLSAAQNDQNSWGIVVTAFEMGASAASSSACLDILVGESGSELPLIESLLVGYVYGGASRSYFFPVHIPAGVRISARHANDTASRAGRVMVYLYGGSPPPFKVGHKVTTYGSKNNDGRGQTITPAQSGAAASVTELEDSTSEAHFFWMPGFTPYNDATIQARYHNIGLGVGSGTPERIGTWTYGFDAGEKSSGPVPNLGAWNHVPAGSRITMLASNSGTNDATYGGLAYAVS